MDHDNYCSCEACLVLKAEMAAAARRHNARPITGDDIEFADRLAGARWLGDLIRDGFAA